MKTPVELIKGCEHDGSFIPVSEVIRLMYDYHAQFMTGAIKAKALRKKGTNLYYRDEMGLEFVRSSWPDCWHPDNDIKELRKQFKQLPEDAELIDTTILIDKP